MQWIHFMSKTVEENMKNFYDSLSEKDKRHYAAIEVLKLPHGSKKYIANLFGCDFKTIQQGLADLEQRGRVKKKRIRNPGGGRRLKIESDPKIEAAFLEVLKDHTAGDPQKENIIWTDLSCTEIRDRMKKMDIFVSRNIIKQLLKKHDYKKRKIQKRLSTGTSANRNEQFENITKLKKAYIEDGNPVISCDTKKKN